MWLRIISSRLTRNLLININKNKLPFSLIHKDFHSCTPLFYKLYVDYENKACHDVMEENSVKYSLAREEKVLKNPISEEEFDKILSESWEGRSPTEILEAYTKLSDYASISNVCISLPKFDTFVDALTDSFINMSETQLETAFKNMRKWPETESLRTRNFIEKWCALDDVCTQKLSDWDFSTALLFADYFYKNNLCKQTEFVQKIISKSVLRTHRLTPSQLIQTAFLIGLCRWAPKDKYNLEERFDDCFDELTLDEVAIFCLGFFKTETNMRNPRVYVKLINKTIEQASTLNEFTLCALLKMIQYSSMYHGNHKIKELLDTVAIEVPRLSFLCSTHLATLGIPLKVKSLTALNAIIDKFKQNPTQYRLKDLERLTLAFTTFNIDKNTGVYDIIISELEKDSRAAEISKHAFSLMDCLSFLTTVDVYPESLISKALSKEQTAYIFERMYNMRGQSLLVLEDNAQMYCKNYDGNVIDPVKKKKMIRLFRENFPTADNFRFSFHGAVTLEVWYFINALRNGSQNITNTYILPHNDKPYLIICDDHAGKPLAVVNSFSKNADTIQYAPDKNKWYSFQILGRNCYELHTGELLGPPLKRIRFMENLGFNSLKIKIEDWVELNNEKEKLGYLVQIFNEHNIYYNPSCLKRNGNILPRQFVERKPKLRNKILA